LRTALEFYNLEPGLVITETVRALADMREMVERYGGAPPEVPAEVVAWLATDPRARELNGKTVSAQRHALEHNLVPEWQPRRRP
jgi:hypothetical protein